MHWIEFDFPSGPTLKIKVDDALGRGAHVLCIV